MPTITVRLTSETSISVGQTVVTRLMWKQCVNQLACPTVDESGSDVLPVTSVSWNDVQDFLAWRSNISGQHYRLPTSEEWEQIATQSGAGTSALQATLLPVKSQRDRISMDEGVSEWTSTCDTRGQDAICDYRIVRGRSWRDANGDFRKQQAFRASSRGDAIGFRVVLDR